MYRKAIMISAVIGIKLTSYYTQGLKPDKVYGTTFFRYCIIQRSEVIFMGEGKV